MATAAAMRLLFWVRLGLCPAVQRGGVNPIGSKLLGPLALAAPLPTMADLEAALEPKRKVPHEAARQAIAAAPRTRGAHTGASTAR